MRLGSSCDGKARSQQVVMAIDGYAFRIDSVSQFLFAVFRFRFAVKSTTMTR
jgi:hypothetical protein